MKILVVSDSHGDFNTFNKLVQSQRKAEVVIFLGDGADEFEDIKYLYPEKMFIGVKGNNDWGSSLPVFDERVIEGKKIFMTHGHTYGVKYGLSELQREAERRGADIALFGHTHQECIKYENGMYIMNPGSLRRYDSTYGVIDIQNGDILVNTAEFK